MTDSFGKNLGTQTIAVTVAAGGEWRGGPETIGITKTNDITIGTVTENFNVSGETSTAVLTDMDRDCFGDGCDLGQRQAPI